MTVSDNHRIAALLALAKHNIAPDIQGLLLNGSDRQNVKPGALDAALSAALQVEQVEPVSWGCFRNGVMVGWVPGPDEPEGREYKLPEDTDERRPLYATPLAAEAAKEG